MSKIFIGTSGWVYSDWKKKFYPNNLSSKEYLKYFSQHFNTTEINYSFYHLPKPSTYKKWYKETPEDFVFSVKVSRFITHIKRLKGVKRALKTFLQNSLNLEEKLGPILFQFPPNFKAEEETIQRLEDCLKYFHSYDLQGAVEFRDESWFQKKVFDLLKKYNTALVISDSSRWPKCEEITADFVYVRMHGPKELFGSKYSKSQLKNLAEKIKKWKKQGLDVYVYFNNDFNAYAIENARTLIDQLS